MLKVKTLLMMCLLLLNCACQNEPDPSVSPKLAVDEIDYILVEKARHRLSLFHKDDLVKTYNIALGKNPIGHKEREGDFKTPEGIYKISKKNPKSKYHRSLKISYPNNKDHENAKKKGHHPGGDIMIHGFEPHYWWVSPKHKLRDLTRGCIALTNQEIEEIFELTPVGTTVEITP